MGDVQVAFKVIIPIIGFYGCARLGRSCIE